MTGEARHLRDRLTFPPLDLHEIGSAELVGYHSYLNWLKPDLAFGRSLRLGLLLFDKVVAETYSPDEVDMMVRNFVQEGKLTKAGSRALMKLVVPIQSLLPEFGLADLMRTPEDSFLEAMVEHYLDHEYETKGQTPPPFDSARSLADMRYSLTVVAFENWFALSRRMACLFIPNAYEEQMLADFLKFLNSSGSGPAKSAFPKFKSVLSRLLPAIDELSVDDVLELRRHEYFASFRRKTRCVVDRLASVDGEEEADRVLKEEEQKDIATILDQFRPRPIRSLVRAVIGNIPIPAIAVNPSSLVDTVTTLRREFKAAREVGWLYFVRDLKARTPDYTPRPV